LGPAFVEAKLSQAAGEEAAGGVVGGHGHIPYRLAVRGRGWVAGVSGRSSSRRRRRKPGKRD
jgi:hypothetical protein